MVIVKICYSMVLFLFQFVDCSHLIQLSANTSIESFLSRHPIIRNSVLDSYSIGGFKAILGNFPGNIVKYLSDSVQVSNISPDIQIQCGEVQREAPRHLARISRRDKLDFDELNYHYSTEGQANITVYVIDTGIHREHPDFEHRVSKWVDFTGEGYGDMNGHGTHVAGLVGSRTYGVAKNVQLFDIKALSSVGAGNLSTVIKGIEFVVQDFHRHNRTALANLSLGATLNPVLNEAVSEAVKSGVPMVVAAGNSNSSACNSSPASAIGAFTVGALDDRYDTLAAFSNWGSCVDIFASGVYVTSLSNSGDATSELSGTSMAAPIISGIMAMFMGQGYKSDQAMQMVRELATPNKIEHHSLFRKWGTPNLIAYNGHFPDSSW